MGTIIGIIALLGIVAFLLSAVEDAKKEIQHHQDENRKAGK
jgi:hypothetical protein